jgi:thiazole/oxazole-forming peptide maturase SagD family component
VTTHQHTATVGTANAIITDRVHVHLLDDENGFVETAHEVRRLRGNGLSGLADQSATTMTRLLRTCGIQDVPAVGQEDTRHVIAVFGPEALTGHLTTIAEQTPSLDIRRVTRESLDDRLDLVVVATASIFDPAAADINALCVQGGLPCLFFGVVRDNVSFVGPLWTPDRFGACYECLRTRISSNSVHGPTWLAYMRHLTRSHGRPIQHRPAPWAAARLAAQAGQRIGDWLRTPGADAADELIWWEEGSEGPSRRHLLAVPSCVVCASSGRAATPIARLADAVDDRVGIVHATSTRQADIGPPVHLGGSTSADFSVIKPSMRVTLNGGAGFSVADAANAAVGEALERYAAGFYRREHLRLAGWCDLDEPAVRPDRFGLFSPEQHRQPNFPFAPFGDQTLVRWTRSTRLGSADTALLPASQVFMHYRRAPGEAAIGPSISTGMAAGPTVAQATLSGLYEVIERDALAISWLHRLPPRPVSPDVIAGSPRVSYHLGSATSWAARFFDLSLDLEPPVIVVVMEHREGNETIMSFGSACRWSAVDAVEKAFLEAAQGLTYVRRLLAQHRDWHLLDDFSNVDDFNKHAVLYTKYPHLRERARYLVDPTTHTPCTRPERPPLPRAQPEDELGAVIDGLAAAGYPSYRVDLTTPDVAQVGAHVVRVVVPGLQHLAGTHAQQLLGNPRLCGVVAALGFGDLPHNPYPHPLP